MHGTSHTKFYPPPEKHGTPFTIAEISPTNEELRERESWYGPYQYPTWEQRRNIWERPENGPRRKRTYASLIAGALHQQAWRGRHPRREPSCYKEERPHAFTIDDHVALHHFVVGQQGRYNFRGYTGTRKWRKVRIREIVVRYFRRDIYSENWALDEVSVVVGGKRKKGGSVISWKPNARQTQIDTYNSYGWDQRRVPPYEYKPPLYEVLWDAPPVPAEEET